MNKNLTDLAEHADFFVGNEHYDKSPEEKQRIWVEKFAELIVRECAEFANHYQATSNYTDISKAIKQHFGVEE